jgi:RNA polymerase sigma-70 factor (ECF subfamily)
MQEQIMTNLLAGKFDDSRARLSAVALRILGSHGEAEDAVQEAWLRLSRSEADEIDNLQGWLTTVVARVCLDMLRARKSRRENELDESVAELAEDAPSSDPEAEVILAETLGPALLIVLERLAPAERVSFVLHDLFDLSFDEIAPIVGRSPVAARQLASRARRRIKGERAEAVADAARQRDIVAAFFAASRAGNMAALLELVDPDVVLRADPVAVKVATANRDKGAPALADEIRGPQAVAGTLKGAARGAEPAVIDGAAGAVWAPGGKPGTAFAFTVREGKIVAIDIIMDRARINTMDIEILHGD